MADEVKKVDINQPVEQGADLVLNHADGSQTLGTAEERDQAEGLQGLHTNPLPDDSLKGRSEEEDKKARKETEAQVKADQKAQK